MNEAELATLNNSNGGENTEFGRPAPESPAGATSGSIDAALSQSPSINPFFHNSDNRASVVPAEVSHAEAFAQPDLERACQEGDLEIVKLLANPATINDGALHHAASNNHWRVCEYLIKKGANVNSRTEPLNATPLLWACRHGHAYIVKLLIDHGADTGAVDSSGFSALHLAVHSSNVLMVAYILHLEVMVDKTDIGERTALHWAIVQGDHLSVEALLKAGASSNLLDGEGTSPLTLAVYTAKSEHIVALLLEYGADPTNGSIVELGLQQPLPLPWIQGCIRAGRLLTGLPRRSRILSPEIAKILTFFAPVVLIPLALFMPRLAGDSLLLGIPLVLIVLYLGKRCIEKFLVPYCWKGHKAMLQSTVFAGVFTGMFVCISLFWLTQIAPWMFTRRPLSAAYIVLSILVITVTYATTMFMDPGKIEPKSLAKRLISMNELMDRGLFDSVHVCLHTYVSVPARARYDFYLDRVICRFDHYCPWLYNSIGVRNHRSFLIFLIVLSIAIPIAGMHYVEYSREFGVSNFGLILSLMTIIQSIWIYVLTLVQLTQIARAATSNEVSNYEQLWLFQTDPIRAYSSLPRDHPKAADVLYDTSSASSLLKHNHPGKPKHHRHSRGKLGLCFRLTGFNQVADAWNTFHRSKRWNMADHGIPRNCMDFWYGGGNPLHPNGSWGLLDGVPVDYSKLDYPLSPRATYGA